ncbi:hypothetical protein D6C89_09661 [Aureobasidium pullulans]|nr:hypothetical protein D6C89_09661 [Aureobasidium pullulans]
MFSGCRDEETSADAQICGALHATRALLKASAYTQVPQLCVGVEMDLDRALIL